jgi:Secretion system C-terminal sorting domain
VANRISFTDTAPALPASSNDWCTQKGIYLGNCKSTIMHSDSIIGRNTTTALSNNRIAGIYLHGSNGYTAKCNIADNTAFGLAVIGENKAGDSTAIANNTFKTSYGGILLRQLAKEGSVGDVGYLQATAPFAKQDNDNKFTDLGSSNHRIYKIGDTCDFSQDKFVTDSTKVNAANPNHNVSVRFNGAANILCRVLVNNPQSATTPICTAPPAGKKPIIDNGTATGIATGNVNYVTHKPGATWLDNYLLQQNLRSTPALRSIPLLDSIYVANNGDAIQLLDVWDEQYSKLCAMQMPKDSSAWQDAYDELQTLNNGIQSEESFVTNAVVVNSLLLKHLLNPALPEEQLTMLAEMAVACPYDKGNAVYKARALMQDIAPGSFYDDLALCNAVGIYKTTAGGSNHYAQENQLLFFNSTATGTIIPVEKANMPSNTILVYPNPASTELHYLMQLQPKTTAMLRLFNSTGSEVFSQAITESNRQGSLAVGFLARGVYVCQVVMASGQCISVKVILD